MLDCKIVRIEKSFPRDFVFVQLRDCALENFFQFFRFSENGFFVSNILTS
jgi:hypothetical protein